MARKRCYEITELGFSITLDQLGVDRFEVTYGKQVDTDLNYAKACAKLGQAIMHALSCEGLVDNREKGER